MRPARGRGQFRVWGEAWGFDSSLQGEKHKLVVFLPHFASVSRHVLATFFIRETPIFELMCFSLKIEHPNLYYTSHMGTGRVFVCQNFAFYEID